MTHKNISCTKINGLDSNTLEDLRSKLVFEEIKDSDLNQVSLKGLPVGEYRIELPKTDDSIRVHVHKGSYWETDSFILKKRCLLENRLAQKMLHVSKVSLAAENDKTRVKINVKNHGADTRVHLFAYNFLPYDLE